LDPLVRFIEADGGAIEITSETSILAESLKSADAFICAAPVIPFTKEDSLAVEAFVERGGKLVVITDPTRNTLQSATPATSSVSSLDASNLLLEPFDVSITDDYLYNMSQNEGNFRNVKISNFAKDELTKGINQLVIYGGHSIHSNGKSLATTGENTFSSANDRPDTFSLIDLVKSGSGNVLVIGDLSLFTTQYVQSADNQVFVQNLANYLTESNRPKTLPDFPHVFSGKIIVLPANQMEVDGKMVSIVSKLEKSLGIKTGGLTISEKDDLSANRILLSTFVSTDETKEVFDKLKINLSPKSEDRKTPEPTATVNKKPTSTSTPMESEDKLTNEESSGEYSSESSKEETGPGKIEIPGMSVISTSDLGLVGLVHEEKRSTLIIVAASPEKLQGFISELSINGLTGCLIQGDVAACKVTGSDLEPKG
jgi:hypothetical protein